MSLLHLIVVILSIHITISADGCRGGDYDGWTSSNNAIVSTLPCRHQESQGYSLYNKMQASRLLERNAFDYKICMKLQ